MWRPVLMAKVAVTLVLLGWLAVKIDVAALVTQVMGGDPGFLLLGLGVLMLQPILGGVRWFLVTRRLELPASWSQTLRWTYAATFVNQLLPATVGGDGLRAWLACRAGAGLGQAVNSIVLDRVAMMLCLLAMVVLSAPAFRGLLPDGQLALLAALLLGGGVVGLVFMFAADALPRRWQEVRLVRWIASLSRDSRSVFLPPGPGLLLLVLSAASILNLMVSVTLFAVAFGAQASFLAMLMVVPPVIAASTLPISIGGWGTREVAMVAVMAAVGVPAPTAVLASVALGLGSLLCALPGAFFHFYGPHPRHAELTGITPESIGGRS